MNKNKNVIVHPKALQNTKKDIGINPNQEIPKPRVFHIFHCINKVHMFTEKENQPRKYVGFVTANSLEEAYQQAQNDFNPIYRKLGIRSTSVGDLIQDQCGFYMVCATGFKLICMADEDRPE